MIQDCPKPQTPKPIQVQQDSDWSLCEAGGFIIVVGEHLCIGRERQSAGDGIAA